LQAGGLGARFEGGLGALGLKKEKPARRTLPPWKSHETQAVAL